MTNYSLDAVHELATEVAGRVGPSLLIRVARSSIRSAPPEPAEVTVEIQLKLEAGLGAEANPHLGCAATYVVSAVAQPTTGDNRDPFEAWHAEVTVHAQWDLDSADELTDDHLRAWAVKVGLMTLHPYVRANIQSTVSVTAWPAYTIDVLTSPESLMLVGDDLLDLSSIGIAKGM